MNLIGLQIHVGSKTKFVGKVGETPWGRHACSDLAGVPVLYREVPFHDFYSHATHAVGVDAAAWAFALSLGARAMVTYCKDRSEVFVVSAESFETAYILDLGERPQYRIPLSRVSRRPASAGLRFGYTTTVLDVPQRERLPAAPPEVMAPPAIDPQLSLF